MSEEVMPDILKRYNVCKNKAENSSEELEGITKEFDSCSLGIEHFLRELGQLYEAYNSKDMLTLGNFYGTLAFLVIGLTVALIIFLMESCFLLIDAKNHQIAMNRPASMYPTT